MHGHGTYKVQTDSFMYTILRLFHVHYTEINIGSPEKWLYVAILKKHKKYWGSNSLMMKQQLVWWQILDKLNMTLIKLKCYL
jgi:hypothetical protein